MSAEILGSHFDIHAGGMDLKFPHHENEIAQSCAATGDHFAHLWMHNGFVNVDDEKMSKSLGNFFTIRDVLASGHLRHPEVLRYFLTSSQYRGPINYSLEQINQADAALGRLYTALRGLDAPPVTAAAITAAAMGAHATGDHAIGAESAAWQAFHVAMDDDFNTPEAIAVLQNLAGEINRARSAGQEAEAAAIARELRGDRARVARHRCRARTPELACRGVVQGCQGRSHGGRGCLGRGSYRGRDHRAAGRSQGQRFQAFGRDP
jgi:cysteinyl-tRNA synthetase